MSELKNNTINHSENGIVKDPFETIRKQKEMTKRKQQSTLTNTLQSTPKILEIQNLIDFNFEELSSSETETNATRQSQTSRDAKRNLLPAPIRLQYGRGGDRLHFREDLHKHMGEPLSVNVAFGSQGCFISKDLPGITKRFDLSFGGKNKECAIYKKELVAEIIQKLNIPYPVGASSFCYYNVEAVVINGINAVHIKPYQPEADESSASEFATESM